MANVQLNQTNFTSGELTPRMHGRGDVARYANGVKTAENCFAVVQGGMIRRYGLRYITGTKYDNKRSKLVAYVFSRTEAYVLEIGDGYFRVFKDGAQIAGPYEVVSPYLEAQLPEIDYVQGADTMFTFHETFPIQRIRRYGDANWTMEAAPFVTEPFDEIGHYPAQAVTLSSAGIGAGRVFTVGVAEFLAADVGRSIAYQSGYALVTGQTATTLTATISVAFPGLGVASGLWAVTGSPQTTCTPSAKDPVGAIITLTLAAAGWRATDVGKFVSINGGLCRITAYTSDLVVSAKILQVLNATTAAVANGWTLNSSVWGGANGYPRTGTLFEQRLCTAGSTGFPQAVWGSVIGEYLNFELGTFDDDAFAFTISSDQINPIEHLTQNKTLIALTYGGEFTIQGGIEKPITPTNVQVKQQSAYGCNSVLPERIGDETYFAQRAGRKLRAMAPNRFDSGQYGSPDLSVLAEHITISGITDMTYQQEPDSLLLCVRGDGQIAAFAIDRDQEVTAASRFITDGTFESVCTVPTATGETTYAIVNRTVNGVTKRSVEYFDAALHTDSAVTGYSAPGALVWSGLGHLEGKTVRVKGDGVVLASKVVTGGSITAERLVHNIEIGLDYVTKIVTLTPELQGQGGSSQGMRMRISEIILRVLGTIGATINGRPVPFRTLGPGVLDAPIEPFTGDKSLDHEGWEKGAAELTIEQRDPLPFHLLSIIKRFTVNG